MVEITIPANSAVIATLTLRAEFRSYDKNKYLVDELC